ncbi:heavy metal translocating P-type ATPase [Enterococcus timonensis]|uniref:heavy metal translocating P-type ATPase n=1 Tax=Enterococcus timonensis TaxID=1852364 RepID=UPI00131A15FA
MKNMNHDHAQHDHSEHSMHDMENMDHDHSEHEMHDMHNMNHDHANHDMNNMNHDHANHDMNNMNHNHAQHDMKHMDHDMSGMDHSMHMGNFKQKFWLSLVLAIPIIILSPMMGISLPFQFTFPGSSWVVLILATILFIYGGQPFLSGAKMELSMKNPGMMTLIAMGISVSYVYSLYAFVMNLMAPQQHVMDFFWELATLIVIMLLGHWIEMNAVTNASSALKKLAELLPDSVVRLTKTGEEKISLTEVAKGDQLKVLAGDKMPTDGVVISGNTTVDESAITGEAKGVKKNSGDKVIGGSVNGQGTITIEVSATGAEGYLAQVMELVRRAQQEKSRLESLSDRVAKWLFYVALIAGIAAFLVWLLVADLSTALERMVTVFVIACPHALGLAIPLVVARSTSIAAQNGLLLKKRSALETGEAIDTVVLDKTGTLTAGKFTMQKLILTSDQLSEDETLAFLGALEQDGNHPIAIGMMNELKNRNVTPHKASEVANLSGIGLSGTVDGKKVEIINEKELDKRQITFDEKLITDFKQKGSTLSFLLIDGKLMAIVALGDEIKPEAKTFIKALKERNITPVMLTGDNEQAAKVVSEFLGIDEYFGGLLPQDKEKIVSKYISEGKKVMMVGDGINDAPSLAKATIGMAIGAGTDIAIESADVVLTNSNPEDILHFLDLAKVTKRKMIQNLWWGAGYNIITIPLAAGVLAPIGIILSPAVGAVLMSLSTVVVAINAMLLRLKK